MIVGATELISRVTGPGSLSDTPGRFDIHGTDLGFIWDAGPGADGRPRCLVMFGDTYGQGWGPAGAGPSSANWRKNVLLSSTDTDFTDGLQFDAAVTRNGQRSASQLISSLPKPVEHTVIPNSGITVHGVHYVHWMSVLSWLGPGRWRTSHAGLAVSVDDGLTWHKRRPLWWNPSGRNRFQIGCFAADADWVYLFGTTNGRYGPAYLSRVRPAEITSGPYTYFDGQGWVGSRRRARPVLSGNVGELSVMPHERYGWLAMHLDETRGEILLRQAPAVTGPWTEGVPVATFAQYPGLYGGFIHPWTVGADDPAIYWTMSRWGDYDVFWMRTELSG
ncbi:DUF4185 domain-containing protein [Naumannella halotolerans]|uniref:Uncharacterized protein DUF4185 n=1 Tax=Naumannella halotolerans TaxID=993414 RepID=A0A4R7J1H0_9ACTN|nr:DUF4185 domain-containing protein [Naumannella halotolerans]TDT30914.1 uncharacterized protein DUF4185 [Naumannella halotolerans]